MDDFYFVRALRGAIYGQVALVQHRRSKRFYAMKMMSLSHMSARRAISGPIVSEDGNKELQILRRLSQNRVHNPLSVHCHESINDDSFKFCSDVYNKPVADNDMSWSMHPLWGQDGNENPYCQHHHHILELQMDFVDIRTNMRCLVFDYCPYGELYDQVQLTVNRTLGEVTTRTFFQQICSAVQFLHAHNIAHRDLSLENILVDEAGHCRVADFGLASEDGMRSSGRVGKAFYMAPEVFCLRSRAAEEQKPDIQYYNGLQADMWSLGVLLFILTTGVPPFASPIESDARFRLVKTQGVGELLRLWQMENIVSNNARDVLARLLRINPTERPTIDELWSHAWLRDGIDTQLVPSRGQIKSKSGSSGIVERRIKPDNDTTKRGFVSSPLENGEEPQLEEHERLRTRKRVKVAIDPMVVNGCTADTLIQTHDKNNDWPLNVVKEASEANPVHFRSTCSKAVSRALFNNDLETPARSTNCDTDEQISPAA